MQGSEEKRVLLFYLSGPHVCIYPISSDTGNERLTRINKVRDRQEVS